MTDQPGTGDRPAGRGPRLLAIVAVVVIGAAGLGLAVFALSPNQAPTSAVHASPSPGPQAVDAPGPTSTPSASIDPGKAVLAKFWNLVKAPDLSYHLTAKGKTTLDRKTIQTYSESLDVVGDTYSGTITSKINGKAQIARQDGVIWVKLPGKPRAGRQTDLRYARLTPFLYLQMSAWLDYVKKVTVGGRHLHLLRSNRYYQPDIARMIDLLKFPWDPDSMTLDLYVTDDGVPASAAFSVAVDVTDSGRVHPIRARTDFAFSKVGDKLKIVVPRH